MKHARKKSTPTYEKLLERDLKELARLVGKYGRDKILEAARKVPAPNKRGRPPRGKYPYFEAMHLADWIDEVAEKHRAAGSRKPISNAEIDLYEMTVDEDDRLDPKHFERWRKNIKKKRLVGRRDLRLVKEAAVRREEWASSLKGRK